MKSSWSAPHLIGALVFALGILGSTLLTAGLTTAGLEATQYGFTTFTNEHFDGLACPPLMTRSETGLIRVTVNNPSGMEITPIMSVDLSARGLPQTRQEQVTVPAGQSGQLEWKVSSENLAEGAFIFAKVDRSFSYPVPAAQALCGILVLDVPFASGAAILFAWLGLCLVCIPLGLWLWSTGRQGSYRLGGNARALAVMALAGLLASLPGWWLLGLFCLVITVLLAVSLVATAISGMG